MPVLLYYENDYISPSLKVDLQVGSDGGHLKGSLAWLAGSRASLARVLSFKYVIHLFEGAPLGLNKEEVYDDELEHIPKHEKRVAAWISTLYILGSATVRRTYNQYVIFSIARGAANVLTNDAQPDAMDDTITPLALMSSKQYQQSRSMQGAFELYILANISGE